jgi:hypothetical protein
MSGETLLERWTLQFWPGSFVPAAKQHNSRSAQARLETSAVYKRLVIMLRSLFSYVRALPAYRLYRAWKVCLTILDPAICACVKEHSSIHPLSLIGWYADCQHRHKSC